MDIQASPEVQFSYIADKSGLLLANGLSSSSTFAAASAPLDNPQFINSIRTFKYSPCGQFIAVVLPECIKIISATDAPIYKTLYELPLKNVIDIEFSPKSGFLCCWERWVKTPDADTSPHKNLTVWNIETSEMQLSFTQKSQANWGLKWTSDEIWVAKLVSSEIQFYDSRHLNKGVATRLKLDNIASFSIAPGLRPIIAVFVPEHKSQPGFVRLYDILNMGGAPLAQKTFFRADRADFYWNALGTSILCLTHTEVDKTNTNYYGETALYFLGIAGNFDCRVELDRPGPIHDVNWSPNSKEFIVVYGTMPAKTTLFDHRAAAIYDFPAAPRNFVRFSPHGRVICLAGFGNLAGEMEMWDRKTFKKVSSINASNTSYCEWSPDGRHLMTAILYKRLKVDNGVSIWHYQGVLTHKIDVKEMYEVSWKPQAVSLFPERSSLSPPPTKSIAIAAPAKPVGVYRPPGARGSGASGFMNREQLDAEKAASIASGGNGSASSPYKASGGNNRSRGIPGSKPTTPSAASTPVPPPAAATTPASSDPEKKIKNIKKKLKQISDIKAKIDKGEAVELTQKQKLETEEALLKELKELEI